jgi:Flp pilus assembly protein TadD
MRVFLALGALACALSADTIVLKNGRRVAAGRVTEQDQRYVYETANGSFSLPKSLVERVERDGAVPPAPLAGVGASRREAPLPTIGARAVRPERLVVDGELDRRYLEELIASPPATPVQRELMVASYLAAVEFELGRGRIDAAQDLARRASNAAPQEPRLLVAQSLALMHRHDYRQARDLLLRAASLAPNSVEVLKFLGFVEYSSDRVEDAVRTWKKAQRLAPDPEIQRFLERAERETAAEERFKEANSTHFTLRFEGQQVSAGFGREILETLEAVHRELAAELQSAPRETILVILYTGQAFYDVTQAPSWTGALFDGKIRVPVEGLSSMTAELRRVLKHEMVHSFIRARTLGRCPAWLNEGLAQALEGRSSAGFAARLAEMMKSGRAPSLAALNEPFMKLEPELVPVAYGLSLAAVEMLRGRYGMGDLARVLDHLASGAGADAALRAALRTSLGEVESELLQALPRR